MEQFVKAESIWSLYFSWFIIEMIFIYFAYLSVPSHENDLRNRKISTEHS